MKKFVVLISIFSVVSFSGCSLAEIKRGETKPQISYVNLQNPNNSKIDNSVPIKGATIFVWSPNNNAAILDQNGKGCIQGADVFNTKDSKIDIGSDILKLVKGITPSGDNSKLIASEITNKITQLRTNTERNSYLSIGMFGLCQLHISGQLSKEDLTILVGQLITESAKIVPKNESPMIFTPTDELKK